MTINQEKPDLKATAQVSQVNQPSARLEQIKKRILHWRPGWPWQVWAAILVLVSGGIGFTATTLLLKLPQAPNCPSIFWPIASASMRLYCAQLEAQEGTVEGLLRAIALVEALPDDHPLRTQINHNVEKWSLEVLGLAEKEFQAGNLEEAITIARKIPENVQSSDVVEKRIQRWQSIWSEGEEIFAEVEKQLRASNWTQAFRAAVQLLNLDNEYWATTKYDETVKQIQLAKEESSRLDEAYVLLRRGGIDNLLKAIAQAGQILPESYAYQEARKLITQAKDKLINYIEDFIDNGNWQALLNLVERIPESLGLKNQVSDWRTLASAGSNAAIGTVEGLQTAIVALEQISNSSPLYDKAQELLNRWKLEIEDVTHLTKARDLAQPGAVNDLSAAIAQAELIPQNNPRYREAQGEISSWTSQIQTIEDQPFLDRARDLASSGSINGLQEAIAQASLISSNRALHREAQREIYQWRIDVEQQEDQPYLDQAESLASAKEFTAAIEAAQQIQRGRALYQEARSKISLWRREIQASQNYQKAFLIAEAKTPEAYVAAINLLRKIPTSTEVGSESLETLNRWSYQLLSLAQDKADSASLQEAIRLAKMIPNESDAYPTARSQIQSWQKMLQPAPTSPTTSGLSTQLYNSSPAGTGD